MNIAKFAVTRPVAVTMQIAALVLLGAICLTRLPVDLLPKVTLPTVSVSTNWPNVAPEEIEAQVTRPVEQALSSTPNLYQINSNTQAGSSRVTVQFNWGTDIGQAAIDVMQRLERAKRAFPNDDTLQMPTVQKFDPNQMPILSYAVTGENNPVKLRSILDNQITPLLESANGVAAATAQGGQERAIIVDVDPVKLRAHHLALADVIRRLVQENINAPAGIARQSETEYTIRSLGWLTSLDEVRGIPLSAPGGQIVTLGQVAQVRDEHKETRVYTRLNGKPAAGISITKQSDANTVETTKAVMAKIADAERMYPNLRFTTTYIQSTYVQRSVDDLKTNALIGGVLAVLILLFFLRNVRSTLVVALSIPISIVSTFALVYLCGFTLNTMSLSGLALATGLIVDDAVVVLENIFRHIERDKQTAYNAAISGTNEIMSAVIASTWTVMVVFLPLLLIKGQSGQMFTQFALVVIFSLAVSLLDAATVVPMLSTRLISGEAHVETMEQGHKSAKLGDRIFAAFGRFFTALDESYRNGLRWALRFRWLTLLGALAITGAAFLLVPFLGIEMLPPTDSGNLSIGVRLPPGTALAKTDRVMRQVERTLADNPDIATYFTTVGAGGRGGFGGSSASQGSVSIQLKKVREPLRESADRVGNTLAYLACLRKTIEPVEAGTRTKATKDVIDELRGPLMGMPGVRPRIQANDLVSTLMTGGDQQVEIDIFGSDLSTLSDLSKMVMRALREHPVAGLENVDVNWQDSMPEIQWQVDRQRAAQLGVTFKDVSDTLGIATNGSTASYFQEAGFQYPIVVQVPEALRKTTAGMANLPIAPGIGGGDRSVVLSQIAHPAYGIGPNQITRQNRQRYIAVQGMAQGRPSGDIQKDLAARLAPLRSQFPSGYYWAWGTQQQRQAEEFGGMGLAIVLAIVIIYMLLAAQFESFTHPLAILFSVPMAATGVILGLFLTGRTFGLTALIGCLMLVGIVVKNGILLVDYTNTLRKRGIRRDEAVLTASPTRLRPILMTACAAILGMLPVAMGIGQGSEIQAPMATAVIGGLITSTLLTLFVVPVVYTFLDDLSTLRTRNATVAMAATEEAGEEVEG
jgi:HAE1 family hydrophobic/amphiphilic exporter-1